MNSDQIEKTVLLRASREQVWRALTDSSQFGSWFGARFDSPFTAGARMHGEIAATTVDAEIAKAQEPYVGKAIEITVERIEPERLFSFRWHPYAIEDGVDYMSEPTTLIEFTLDESPDGILLTVTESGFDRIPLDRRAKAFSANEQGWAAQMTMIQKYLARGGDA